MIDSNRAKKFYCAILHDFLAAYNTPNTPSIPPMILLDLSRMFCSFQMFQGNFEEASDILPVNVQQASAIYDPNDESIILAVLELARCYGHFGRIAERDIILKDLLKDDYEEIATMSQRFGPVCSLTSAIRIISGGKLFAHSPPDGSSRLGVFNPDTWEDTDKARWYTNGGNLPDIKKVVTCSIALIAMTVSASAIY